MTAAQNCNASVCDPNRYVLAICPAGANLMQNAVVDCRNAGLNVM